MEVVTFKDNEKSVNFMWTMIGDELAVLPLKYKSNIIKASSFNDIDPLFYIFKDSYPKIQVLSSFKANFDCVIYLKNKKGYWEIRELKVTVGEP